MLENGAVGMEISAELPWVSAVPVSTGGTANSSVLGNDELGIGARSPALCTVLSVTGAETTRTDTRAAGNGTTLLEVNILVPGTEIASSETAAMKVETSFVRMMTGAWASIVMVPSQGSF